MYMYMYMYMYFKVLIIKLDLNLELQVSGYCRTKLLVDNYFQVVVVHVLVHVA